MKVAADVKHKISAVCNMTSWKWTDDDAEACWRNEADQQALNEKNWRELHAEIGSTNMSIIAVPKYLMSMTLHTLWTISDLSN